MSGPARRASAPSAAARPSSDSSGGKIPRATSRRSSSATVVRSLSRSRDIAHAVGIRDDACRVVADLVPDRRDLGADAVPELLLEAVPLRVSDRDEALAGPPELLGLRRELLRPTFEVDRQPRVLESDTRVRREILEQRSLGRPEGIAERLRDREIPDRLAGVLDRQRQVGFADVGPRRPRRRPHAVRSLRAWQDHPNASGARPDAARRRLRHVGEQLVDRRDLSDPIAELGHHLVRG